MHQLFTIRQAAIALTVATSLSGVAAADTFRNGESMYGQPAAEGARARAVDVQNSRYADVAYGETVVFRGASGQQFAWTFNGLGGRSLNLAKIAPAGFAPEAYKVYVRPNPLYRR